jgi:hypothetical protein
VRWATTIVATVEANVGRRSWIAINMRRVLLLVVLSVSAACGRGIASPSAHSPSSPSWSASSSVGEEEARGLLDARLLHLPGDEDPGWARTIARMDAEAPKLDLRHVTHDLSMRGRIFYKEVQREIATLNIETSYYAHMTYMNESTGTRRTDCSGFVDYALGRVLPDAYEKVPHPETQRPLADDWYDYLVGRYQSPSTQETVRWREIRHVGELVPGDLVVWLKPQNVTGDNTGHIMIVLARPTAGRASERLVRIGDSTTSPHANDSRGTERTGIGTGTIGLKVDGWDRPVAYWWRGGLSYNAYETPIAMGRVE